ncbi:MAG: thioredoxin family protein [Rhodocyclaceae bacterium]|nr:thioredoxin family protein [Rhodocyclaceae bacterium]
MKRIQVLGSGCAKCRSTVALIERVAAARGAEIVLEKVEDMPTIASFGVLSTPAVVIDGTVVHAGGVPNETAVTGWFGG